MEKVGSHIQMPRSALKYFEDNKHQLYFIDIEQMMSQGKSSDDHINLVRKGHSKSLNTEKGYYSDFTEAMLSEEIERP